MAFPVLESVTDTDFATSVTSMAVNMPTTVNPDDRLIALCHVRNAGTWTTVPAGWRNLKEQLGGASVGELSIFEKVADGDEDDTTATWVTGTGTSAAWQVLRVSGAHTTTNAEVTSTSGDVSDANPPSETASWAGSEDNLFIAVAGHSAISTTAWSAAPSGYSGFAQNGASSGGAACCVAHGYKESAADTDDPGTFTVSGSNRFWAAATIVIRPTESGAASLDFELSSSQFAYITDASQSGLDLSSDFTIEAWLNLEQLPSTAGTSFAIVSKDRDASPLDRSYLLEINSSNDKIRIIVVELWPVACLVLKEIRHLMGMM